MRTEITFRHFESNPKLKEHATKGLQKLSRYYDGITDARVVLGFEAADEEKKSAEISVGVYRRRLTASETATTHEEAINDCVSHLRRQIIRYKDKLHAVDKDFHR